MEMGLQTLGSRAGAISLARRRTNYFVLLAGGAVGGALIGSALSGLGLLIGLRRIATPVVAIACVLIAIGTLRRPDRAWGWNRQVRRHSSFGVTRPMPVTFLWGIELGSGIATVITQSATLAVLAILSVSPIGVAAAAGASFGLARLVRTWRGAFPAPGQPFALAIERFGAGEQTVSRINEIFVCAVACLALGLLVADTISAGLL